MRGLSRDGLNFILAGMSHGIFSYLEPDRLRQIAFRRFNLVGLSLTGGLHVVIRLLTGLSFGLVLFRHVGFFSPDNRLRKHLKFAILTAWGYLSNGNPLRDPVL